MMPIKDMFYPSEVEPVWIVKPEKKPENKDKDVKPEPPPPPTPQELIYGPFYPFYHPEYKPPAAPKKPDPAAKKLVHMKVPICCSECVDTVRIALEAVKGVKAGSVVCDVFKEKVTVEITTASNDDVVLACRDHWEFRNARLWSKDDDF